MTAVPPGFRLRADRDVRRHDGGRLLIGGSPRRVLRLTERGADVAGRLLDGEPVTNHDGAGVLARRLLDAGIAHPIPHGEAALTLEVVVPVFDDADGLEECLCGLSGDLAVTVVDDGSSEPHRTRIAAVAARHGARLLRHDRNGGPAAARNTGAAACVADVVAFVDSDAVVSAATLRRLATHLVDPAVSATAPRVRARDAGRGLLGVLGTHWSPLDLGSRPGPVAPAQRVAYVPSTVLAVRRQLLVDGGGFDESLRYGEDVDLVWRLAAAGTSVRYDPSLQVRHAEPQTWKAWLRRRFAYGTSAATLVDRHGNDAAPLLLAPAPAAAVLAALCGAPMLGTAIVLVTGWRLRRRLRAAAVPTGEATRGALWAPVQAALGAARWADQLWWPVMLVAAGSRRRRPAVVAVLLAPALMEYVRRRPPMDPVRWTLAVWVDEAAYGLGVWRGALRARTVRPLLPRITRRRP